ncbi:tautomerase family protein [Nocardia sp. CA2R105]|uniref:tautomerase family protein n=1 Tax=Nocardia coffeae TaxID=2873381 RepID=UPI001CA73174|nr:tautomerase family protein [Nocardia coffeae]MBY8856768.1 tautomerase family protein [Nocardia coffeae]
MPTYECYTHRGQVDAAAKAQLAAGIAQIHHEVTGAPIMLSQCIFHTLDPDDHFIGGQPAHAHGVWIHGHIRSKPTGDRNKRITAGISDLLTRTLQIPSSAVWVYLNELSHGDMLEFGHALPEPGAEQGWLDNLLPKVRNQLAARKRAEISPTADGPS